MANKFKCEKLANGNLRTGEVRLAYVNLLKPRANNNGGKEKYSVAALFPRGADIRVLEKAAEECAKEKFGDKYAALSKAGKIRMPFKDQGDNVDDDGEPRAGFEEGCVYISANANADRRPPVVSADLATPLVDVDDVYSGMWARLSIRPYAYDVDGNRGVSFGLQAVQKLWDDEPLAGFGGKVDVSSEFEAFEVEEGASADSVFD